MTSVVYLSAILKDEFFETNLDQFHQRGIPGIIRIFDQIRSTEPP